MAPSEDQRLSSTERSLARAHPSLWWGSSPRSAGGAGANSQPWCHAASAPRWTRAVDLGWSPRLTNGIEGAGPGDQAWPLGDSGEHVWHRDPLQLVWGRGRACPVLARRKRVWLGQHPGRAELLPAGWRGRCWVGRLALEQSLQLPGLGASPASARRGSALLISRRGRAASGVRAAQTFPVEFLLSLRRGVPGGPGVTCSLGPCSEAATHQSMVRDLGLGWAWQALRPPKALGGSSRTPSFRWLQVSLARGCFAPALPPSALGCLLCLWDRFRFS